MQPTLTLNPMRRLVYVNTAGLKLLPEIDYALFLISSNEKLLNIYPCDVNTRDAVRLRSGGLSKNKPRYIRFFDDFGNKLLDLMNWQSDCRYRLHGKMAIIKDFN